MEAEFEADKATEVTAELPALEEPSVLPGWGAWTAQQKDPKWIKDAKDRVQRWGMSKDTSSFSIATKTSS